MNQAAVMYAGTPVEPCLHAMRGRRVDTIQYNQSGGSQSPGIRTR